MDFVDLKDVNKTLTRIRKQNLHKKNNKTQTLFFCYCKSQKELSNVKLSVESNIKLFDIEPALGKKVYPKWLN